MKNIVEPKATETCGIQIKISSAPSPVKTTLCPISLTYLESKNMGIGAVLKRWLSEWVIVFSKLSAISWLEILSE